MPPCPSWGRERRRRRRRRRRRPAATQRLLWQGGDLSLPRVPRRCRPPRARVWTRLVPGQLGKGSPRAERDWTARRTIVSSRTQRRGIVLVAGIQVPGWFPAEPTWKLPRRGPSAAAGGRSLRRIGPLARAEGAHCSTRKVSWPPPGGRQLRHHHVGIVVQVT